MGNDSVANISRFTVRTSDRRLMRRCFRKWGWASSMRMNLERQGAETNIHFWFGTAIHFALEDYHGYNRFGDPRRAFKAYYEAFPDNDRPDGAAMMYDIGIGMLAYYILWYEKHNQTFDFQTIWFDAEMNVVPPFTEGAVPATEQRFFLDLGIKALFDVNGDTILCEYKDEWSKQPDGVYPCVKTSVVFLKDYNPEDPSTYELYYYTHEGALPLLVRIIPIHYHGTMDRLVIDRYDRWWILDYKTAKGADTNKLDTDDQISAYLWAASQWFGHKFYGFIYHQLTKEVARPPKRLNNGELSVDKKQKTTYALVKKELLDDFGDMKKVPNKYIDFLNTMAEKETPEGDRFIRWDMVLRSDNQLISTYNHIIGETRLMIDPNLYLFPNPTRDCSWDCPIRDLCIAMDDGRHDEVKFAMSKHYQKRARKEDKSSKEEEWMARIKWPTDGPLGLASDEEFGMEHLTDLNVILPDEYVGFEFIED